MGMGSIETHRAGLSFPFKGKDGMGMGSIETHRAVLSFPFKGKDGMGMGFYSRDLRPIPTSVLPLKGRMRNARCVITWPTSVLPLKGRMKKSLHYSRACRALNAACFSASRAAHASAVASTTIAHSSTGTSIMRPSSGTAAVPAATPAANASRTRLL